MSLLTNLKVFQQSVNVTWPDQHIPKKVTSWNLSSQSTTLALITKPTTAYNETRNTFCRTQSLSNATFSFLITRRSSSSKSAAVYKISSKYDDFLQRYGDITIFKMAAVRHLGIVSPPYGPPTKSLLLAAADCHISCQFDTQIWRYLAWNAYSAPKMGVLGDFRPLNVIHHRDPQKAHPCVNPGF